MNYLDISSVDTKSRIAHPTMQGTYPLSIPKSNRDLELFYRIENRLAYLNGPCQWVLNYVHDIEEVGAASGIRNDDEQYFTLIEENVVWKVYASGILTKNINMIENNILVDCYGLKRVFCYLSLRNKGHSNGTGIRRNILYSPANGHQPQMDFVEVTKLLPASASGEILLWSEENPAKAQQEMDSLIAKNKYLRSIVADSLFVDPENGDFHLRPESPAFNMGFREIDHWGLRGAVGPQ